MQRDRGLAFAVEQAGYGLEIVARKRELAGAVNLWNGSRESVRSRSCPIGVARR